jgi:hypothetical protein
LLVWLSVLELNYDSLIEQDPGDVFNAVLEPYKQAFGTEHNFTPEKGYEKLMTVDDWSTREFLMQYVKQFSCPVLDANFK